MGTPVTRKEKINRLKRSPANNYIAEIFFEELQFILGEDLQDQVMVICHGMNTRTQSKDILSASVRYVSTLNSYKEIVTLHLARNSIYHQLPELLFHPLVISTPGMSNREFVEAIRANKSKEKELVAFFSPFDTAFFKEHVKINSRYLNFFTDSASRENLNSIIETLLNVPLSISAHQKYKLFLFLCNAEKYKENLPEIERIFLIVLNLRIQLKLIPHVMTASIYHPIGEGILGETLGLNGEVECEEDDLEAMIEFEQTQSVDDYHYLTNTVATVSTILEFFILSFRKIHVKYRIVGEIDCILGEKRLGYDMNL